LPEIQIKPVGNTRGEIHPRIRQATFNRVKEMKLDEKALLSILAAPATNLVPFLGLDNLP